MSWNLEEFYLLCSKIDNVKDFMESLDKKLIKAKVISLKAIERWNQYFSNNEIIDFGTEKFNEVEFDVEMYMEAALQFAHSTGDILAQILNKTVLEIPYLEHAVSISKVKDRLSGQQHTDALECTIDEFLQSPWYQYINAFVNTIKHRRIIESFTYVEYGEGTENKIGLQFQQFKYRDKNYSCKYADEILNVYFLELQRLIENVGMQINEYLKAQRLR